jgi:O-antigen ligase
MFLHSRLLGVGYSQFTEHHYLTAHNAYILSAGELGLPGMWLFIILMLLAIKIPIAALQHPAHDAEGQQAKSLAMAMLATFGGTAVGIFMLSWTYHYVLWIHFGLSGALYATIKARDPSFEVRLTRRDMAIAFGLCVAIIVGLAVQAKRKGAW